MNNFKICMVANRIRVLVNEIKEEEQQREKLASLAEYKKFVSKLPSIVEKRKSVGNFTRLAGLLQRRLIDEFFTDILRCEHEILKNAQPDKVLPFIENAIIEKRDKVSILRLITIQAMYAKGLKPFVLHSYAKLMVQDGVHKRGEYAHSHRETDA
uniref:MIF4G domain-containing protein n=1 Tax=Globodera pallida TaxID=36090 RepID=A0A183C441_GLOPA